MRLICFFVRFHGKVNRFKMLGYSEDTENQLSLLSSKTSASGKGGYTPTIFSLTSVVDHVHMLMCMNNKVSSTSFASLISCCERINKFSL